MKRASSLILLLITFLMAAGSVKSYPLVLKSDNRPDFEQVKLTVTSTQTGVEPAEGTFRNNGSAPATTGIMPSLWEEVYYTLELSNGIGILNESRINHDIDGNGNKTDTFEVKWDYNETRPSDATIDGVHVYAISEGSNEDPFMYWTYFINGKSKFFQLGNKTHALYYANNEFAEFSFDAFMKYLPSPAIVWVISTWDNHTIEHLTITDFKINGETIKVNFSRTWSCAGFDWFWDERAYVLPAPEIGVGEEVNLSCTLQTNETIIIDVFFFVAWSPDGVNRFVWSFLTEGIVAYNFIVNLSSLTTTTTTTTLSTTNGSAPGFSFFAVLSFILPIVFVIHKRKYK